MGTSRLKFKTEDFRRRQNRIPGVSPTPNTLQNRGVQECCLAGEIYLYRGHINAGTGSPKLTNLSAHTIRSDNGNTISCQLDNQGTIEASNGNFTLAGSIDQFSGSTLTGGTWIVSADSSLIIDSASDSAANQGTVVLDGVESQFDRIDTLADNQGTFETSNGREFSTADSLTNSGTITIGAGSTLTVNGSYTQAALAPMVDQGPPNPMDGQAGSKYVRGLFSNDG